uniref:CSON009493 protein n=1 Tax=Culicoides sonorensis TaxID=179676 RepID=A0A336M0I5_CULSO
MRKYQQLTLLVLTVLSVSILVMYKRENAKLKYVLDVVNFFGRNDADAILKLENDTVQIANVYDLGYPMASWQWIGNNFHAYSAFWKQNNGGAGGEVTALVVGLPHVAVNFKCFVRFADKGKMKGRFSFVRLDETMSTQFKFYKFYCKYDGSPRKVIGLTVVDVESKQEHTLLTRDLQNKQIHDKISLTVCLDMNTYNESLDNFATNINIQQFFYHYHILGATEFIVYGAKGMTTYLKNHLLRHGIQPNIFPYNFPFDQSMQQPNRAIITIDCLLRTSNIAQYTVIAGINEYLYPFTSRFKAETEFYQFMEQYTDMTQFEVTTRQICISPHNKLILSDNNLSELLPSGEKFYLYRPQYNYENYKTIILDAKRISVNRYINCSENANVFDWRHLIDETSLRYINTISKELNLYLMQ